MIEELIQDLPLFASLPDDEIHNLSEMLERKSISEGTLLIREDESQGGLFILLEGKVDIIKALGTADERLLAVDEAISLIGEMSLFTEKGQHTASVRASTPLQILEMSRQNFDALLHRQPRLAYEMVRTLTSRLDESEDLTIRDLRRKNKELQQAYDDLKAAQEQIIEKEKLERELELAREIQSNILPRESPQRPGFMFGQKMVPMSQVGGDFYDLIPLGEDTLGIAVGDVSDHGVPAALFMAMTVTLLRAEAYRAPTPSEVLRNIDLQLRVMNDMDMFVTLLYGILNYETRTFTYARAGHTLPILLDPKGEIHTPQRSPGQPIGLFPDFDIDENHLDIAPGASLFLYTDGVTEAIDLHGELFGEERLKEMLRTNRQIPAQDLCEKIFQALDGFREGDPQHDDVTVLMLQTE